jgi:hypothetical protein
MKQKPTKTHHIYQLIDPRDMLVKYVGKTTNPKGRYKQHINKLDKQQTPKRTWLEDLKSHGFSPIMKIRYKTTDEARAREIEQQELDRHKRSALNIHNPRKGSSSRTWDDTGKLEDPKS